jgi:deoxyadenosine/deoxycytidine kinase
LSNLKYIAIEGNIGAGKTTLAKILSKRLKARLVLEEFADNPFLAKFYEEPDRYAFSVEMAFLADRYHQLSELPSSGDLFQSYVIADYAPFKSLIFAQNNLSEAEFRLYRQFWQMAFQNVPKPDLLIYLQRTNTSLLSNIHSRGRDFEQNLKEPYLMKLTERYSFYLNHFWEGRVLRIDADAKDFLHSETDVQWLIDEIEVL